MNAFVLGVDEGLKLLINDPNLMLTGFDLVGKRFHFALLKFYLALRTYQRPKIARAVD